MQETVKERIDSFICEINEEINWKYLKSSRALKKRIGDLVFQIDFHSSKYNDADQIEIRSECSAYCKSYGNLPAERMIAYIPFLTDADYWWDITDDDKGKKVSLMLIKEIETKVLPIVGEMERDFSGGLKSLVYGYGFKAFFNSIRLIDERLGREEALKAAEEYAGGFTKMEKNILKGFAKGKRPLVNERNLRYMVENRLIVL